MLEYIGILNAERTLMKKLLSLALAAVLLLSCIVLFAACNSENDKLVGTYEMSSVSGTVTYEGQTVELEEDLYDYYRLTLNKDGTCLVESKGAGTTTKIEEEGTWEYEDDVLKIKTKSSGVTAVEEMTWKNDRIYYDAEVSVSGMTVEMSLILRKKS